jgi:hypothetical protein
MPGGRLFPSPHAISQFLAVPAPSGPRKDLNLQNTLCCLIVPIHLSENHRA